MVVQRCHHCGKEIDRSQEEAGAYIKIECLNSVHNLTPMTFHLACWSSVAGDEYIEPFLKEIQEQIDNPLQAEKEYASAAFSSNLQGMIGQPANKGTLAAIKSVIQATLADIIPVGVSPKVEVVEGPGIAEVKVDVTLESS